MSIFFRLLLIGSNMTQFRQQQTSKSGNRNLGGGDPLLNEEFESSETTENNNKVLSLLSLSENFNNELPCSVSRKFDAPRCLKYSEHHNTCGDGKGNSHSYLLIGQYCEKHWRIFNTAFYNVVTNNISVKYASIAIKNTGLKQIPLVPILSLLPIDTSRDVILEYLTANPMGDCGQETINDRLQIASLLALATSRVTKAKSNSSKITHETLMRYNEYFSSAINKIKTCQVDDKVAVYLSADYQKSLENSEMFAQLIDGSHTITIDSKVTRFDIPLCNFPVLDILTITSYEPSILKTHKGPIIHSPNLQIINGYITFGVGFGCPYDAPSKNNLSWDYNYSDAVTRAIHDRDLLTMPTVLYLERESNTDSKIIHTNTRFENNCRVDYDMNRTWNNKI